MRRSVRASFVALLGAFLLTTLVVVPATAGPPRVGSRADHDRVVAFWTKARIAAAKPRDMTLQPRVKPAAGVKLAAAAVTGAQWPDGKGLVYRATGRILFSMAGGLWVCSGAVATETKTDRSIVVTAAHCAYDQASKTFATNWMFMPEFDKSPQLFDCSLTSRGCWTATSLVVSAGFANRGGFDLTSAQSDWAFAVVGNGGLDGATTLDTTVGSFNLSFSSYGSGTATSAFGYPYAAPYDGSQLVYCQGGLGFDFWTLNRTYRLGCNQTGGSSGGEWLVSFPTSGDGGTIMSVNSYGYSGQPYLYGPKFNARTQAAWTTALTTTTNAIVP
jgi:hypothetical protein